MHAFVRGMHALVPRHARVCAAFTRLVRSGPIGERPRAGEHEFAQRAALTEEEGRHLEARQGKPHFSISRSPRRHFNRNWMALEPSALPRLHRDCAHPCHIYSGIGLTHATPAPGLGSPAPRLHRLELAHTRPAALFCEGPFATFPAHRPAPPGPAWAHPPTRVLRCCSSSAARRRRSSNRRARPAFAWRGSVCAAGWCRPWACRLFTPRRPPLVRAFRVIG